MAHEIQVTFDCVDPGALAPFWAETLGYRVQEPPGDFASWDEALAALGVPPERRNDASAIVDPEGAGPRLFFQRVPGGQGTQEPGAPRRTGSARLQGEERMAALETECDRLVTIGARRLRRFRA
jgi:hypothetical protein